MAGAGDLVTSTYDALEEELLALFDRGVDAPLADGAFTDLALRVFRFQCGANPLYRAFVERRGLDPGSLQSWQEIPALPTRAFKAAPLVAGSPEDVEMVFRTSGTTRGRAVRGEHHVRSLDLYRASLTPNLRAHLLPEGRALPVLALVPSPRDAPDSSLSFMVGEAAGWWAVEGEGMEPDEGSRRQRKERGGGMMEMSSPTFFVDPASGIREGAFREGLRGAEEAGRPVLLVGTAFAFAQWMEIAREEDGCVTLPPGSRIMETGGFKGRTRVLSREELYGGMEDAFGVPRGLIVNEYGMTELLSQFYEPVLVSAEARGPSGAEESEEEGQKEGEEEGTKEGKEGGTEESEEEAGDLRFHRPPPWVRTVALHPLTLRPVAAGEPGILAHLDLANLGSVARVLTEDLGTMVEGGFVLAGRSPGAEPRGCSLAMEDFMTAMEED